MLYTIQPHFAKELYKTRKHFTNNHKDKDVGFPTYWDLVEGLEGEELTLANIADLIERVRTQNQAVVLLGARPRDISITTGFQRKTEVLRDQGQNYLILDFDGEHASINFSSPIGARLDVAQEMVPFLPRGKVASLSSSAYFADSERPNRLNLHVIVMLDKLYPREKIKGFYQWVNEKYPGVIDASMASVTQPLYIANPVFTNTPMVEHEQTVLLVEGECLSLDAFGITPMYGARVPSTRKGSWNAPLAITDETDKTEALYHKWKELVPFPQGCDRNNKFYKALYSENWSNRDISELYHVLSKPDIAGGQNVYDIFARARDNVFKLLNGEEVAPGEYHPKTLIHVSDLEDWDGDLPETGIVVFQSGCGTGKTKGIAKRLIESGRYKSGLYTSSFKGTVSPVAEAIPELFDYLDFDSEKGEIQSEKMKANRWVALCEKSLHKLTEVRRDGRYFEPRDLIIIDESERVAEGMIGNPYSEPQLLIDMCLKAKMVVLLDADATDGLTGLLASEIEKESILRRHVYQNTFDWYQDGHQIYLLKSERQAYMALETLLQKGKRLFIHVGFSDSTDSRKMSAIVRWLKKRFPSKKIKSFDSAQASQELRKAPNETIDEWFKEGLDALIVSPWAKIGWDYNSSSENNQFDATVGIYPHDFMGAEDILQATRRPRKTRLHYIWATQGKGQNILRFERELKAELESLSSKGWIKERANFFTRLCNAKNAAIIRRKENIPLHIRLLAEYRGAEVHTNCVMGPEVEDIKSSLKIEGNAKYREDIEREWPINDVIGRLFFRWEKNELGEWAKKDVIDQFAQTDEFGSSDQMSPKLPLEVFEELYQQEDNQIPSAKLPLDVFAMLYERDREGTKKMPEVLDLCRLWSMTVEEREEYANLKDIPYPAMVVGQILDELSQLLMPDKVERSVLDWLANPEAEPIHLFAPKSGFGRDLKSYIQCSEKLLVQNSAPLTLFKKAHTKSAKQFLIDIGSYFGFQLKELEGRFKLPEAKKSLIAYYAKIKLMKDTKGQRNARADEAYKIVMERKKSREKLSTQEWDYLCAEFRVFEITREPIVHKALHEIIDRYALWRRQKGAEQCFDI